MVKIETTHIKPLNGSNYPRWKLEMSTALEAVDLWGHCSGSDVKPNPVDKPDECKKWLREDARTRGCILPLLDDRQS